MKEISERHVAPCFVNGLEAYDGEINLENDKNLISNEFAVKLCLEHEVKNGDKVVKKELIVALRGEIYFVKFIINHEEDDIEPGVVLRRSFLNKLKLDGELKLEEVEANEEMIREYKAMKEKDDLGACVLPIRLEGRFDTHALVDTGSNINIILYRIFEELEREHVKPVSHSFYVSEIQNNVEESNNDDEEEYYLKRDEMGRPFYGMNLISYFDRNDPMERALAIHDLINPFQKMCVWKKVVAFLGSLPVTTKILAG
ncbi:hypothetical protein Tco_1451200 [Tanacetum coccineum]